MPAGTRDMERCSVNGRKGRRRQETSGGVLIRSSSARRDGTHCHYVRGSIPTGATHAKIVCAHCIVRMYCTDKNVQFPSNDICSITHLF